MNYDPTLTNALVCGPVPDGWLQVGHHSFFRPDGLNVILTGEVHTGLRWVHVNCSRLASLPSWEDLRDVHRDFLGAGRQAFTVLPPETSGIGRCLHVLTCLDVDILPEINQGSPS